MATFSRDLAAAYAVGANGSTRPSIVALIKKDREESYDDNVLFRVNEESQSDYITAAEFLNRCPAEVINVQHEYGIFGGPDGSYVLDLMNALEKPIVVTLHTVLPKPTQGQQQVLSEVCDGAAAVVVLADAAVDMLTGVYGVSLEKIVHIPHGAPEVPFSDPAYFQESLGLAGKQVVMQFGLLGPSKGIETAIRAIAKVAPDFPNLIYVIVGATHPELVRSEGEAYRESLQTLGSELNVSERIVFVNEFLSDKRLLEYLQAADIFVSPYPGADQISSGTLAFAVAAGKAVIATPYVAARELLAEGRGLLTPFSDEKSLADNIRYLLTHSASRVKMRKAAYRYGKKYSWTAAGEAYRKLFSRVREGEFLSSRPQLAGFFVRPELRWDHLRSLTDVTGTLQHAKYRISDRSHGYCTDDNARLLLLACEEWQVNENLAVLPLMRTSLAFLLHAYNRKAGRMRNFMSYERKWLEAVGSDDSQGRSIWALGAAIAVAPHQAEQNLAFELFHGLLAKIGKTTSPRAWSMALLGATQYLRRFQGDLRVQKLTQELADRLVGLYEKTRKKDWRWFERILAYDNARLSEGLLTAFVSRPDPKYLQIGIESLDWLFEACTSPEGGQVSLIGNRGWWTSRGKRAKFDQQPLDASALVSAAKLAYELTEDARWRKRAETAFEWFLGRNDLGVPLIDPQTGGCSDGLTPMGINKNMGAESTIAWMLATLDILDMEANRGGWQDAEREVIELASGAGN